MSVLTASSSGVNVRLVMGLEEDVSYAVCVMAINSVGAGPCSGSLTETTFEDSKLYRNMCCIINSNLSSIFVCTRHTRSFIA